ncbi:hypothetical protein [Niallia sp. 03190]|uniref:hypothetical protein n=1 Tax=Niallia sp. 03190 TaxID=3458061 RepID=UPI0040451954
MGYINPLFSEQKIIKETTTKSKIPSKPRKTRSDKTHNIKFPVTEVERMKLRSLCQQVKRKRIDLGKSKIEQTQLNTMLLKYGLENQYLITWDWDYKDSKTRMHTNVLETQYEREIGGPHGLTIRKGLSDRKVAYMAIMSVLKWLEGDGDIEKIIQ